MPTLEAGTKAPIIKLPTMSEDTFDLAAALARGPVALAFFKVSCPICQLTFPYLERLHRANAGSKLQMVGVSQDSKADTAGFLKEYGITFPIALDDTSRYLASNAYGLTNVPTVFLVSPAGAIELLSVGWYKKDIEDLNAKMAALAGKPPQPVFRPGEDVPDFKAG
jgi:peroxiredoxin